MDYLPLYLVFGWVWMIPAAVSAIAGLIGQRQQRKANQRLADSQNVANIEFQRQQNEYNTPANQMSRYQAAGLNPNLVYGQGNPGNQSSPVSYPDVQRTDYQSMPGQLAPLLNQTAMTVSQTAAIDAKTRQTFALTELNKLQARVIEANPLLDNSGFKATIQSLVSAAEIKAGEASLMNQKVDWSTGNKSFNINGVPTHGPAGVLKMEQELNLLEQRFKLGGLDAQLKAEVLTSKEFQNAILEVQKKWAVDGEITPQHILQFIQLLLTKALTPGFIKSFSSPKK